MRKAGVSIALLLLISGCTSVDRSRGLFLQQREDAIGRNVDSVRPEPIKVVEDTGGGRYYYEFYNTNAEDFCRWSYRVEDERVVSWRYEGKDAACYLEFKWGTPW